MLIRELLLLIEQEPAEAPPQAEAPPPPPPEAPPPPDGGGRHGGHRRGRHFGARGVGFGFWGVPRFRGMGNLTTIINTLERLERETQKGSPLYRQVDASNGKIGKLNSANRAIERAHDALLDLQESMRQ